MQGPTKQYQQQSASVESDKAQYKASTTFPPIQRQQMPQGSQLGNRGLVSKLPDTHRILVWKKLELGRSKKIGVKPLQGFDVTRSHNERRMGHGHPQQSGRHWGSMDGISFPKSGPLTALTFNRYNPDLLFRLPLSKKNALAPFITLHFKPTCGYFFSDKTENRKVRTGVPPSDLVKWRNSSSIPGFMSSASAIGPNAS